MAQSDLQLQVLTLNSRAIADTRNLQTLGEPLRDTKHEIIDQRPLHTPHRARAIAILGRLDLDGPFVQRRLDLGHELELQFALWTFHGNRVVLDGSGHTLGERNRFLADA